MQPDLAAAVYVAPARYVLTVLHRPDPSSGPGRDGEGEPAVGQTLCGLFMGESELWRPVDGRDGDLLCTGCMLPGSAESAVEAAPQALTEEPLF